RVILQFISISHLSTLAYNSPSKGDVIILIVGVSVLDFIIHISIDLTPRRSLTPAILSAAQLKVKTYHFHALFLNSFLIRPLPVVDPTFHEDLAAFPYILFGNLRQFVKQHDPVPRRFLPAG
ncbi:MAG: hypothetical protein OXG15_09890, partial [Gammaproteobacteria bacterium]|nr:hypothetical protein [Gammaproteobacteria bacterium]